MNQYITVQGRISRAEAAAKDLTQPIEGTIMKDNKTIIKINARNIVLLQIIIPHTVLTNTLHNIDSSHHHITVKMSHISTHLITPNLVWQFIPISQTTYINNLLIQIQNINIQINNTVINIQINNTTVNILINNTAINIPINNTRPK